MNRDVPDEHGTVESVGGRGVELPADPDEQIAGEDRLEGIVLLGG